MMTPEFRPQGGTYLMSDLHLDDSRPELTRLFIDFLQHEARRASAVYLLGDIFEVWVGDDDDGALPAQVAAEIRAVGAAGVAVYFMHGNRDFLLGPEYAAAAGMQLLPDPFRVTLGGVATLLSHGDRYCLADTQYQTFRKQARDPAWQASILAQPLAARRALAKSLRSESMMKQEAQASAGLPFSDVDDGMVAAEMAAHGVRRLIHGHTHRPNVHAVALPDGNEGERIVLSDWHGSIGEAMTIDSHGAVVRHRIDLKATDVDMKNQPTNHYTSLDEVAQRLHDVRIDRIVRGYKERRVSIIRAVLTGLVLAWALFWMRQAPTTPSHEGGTLWIEGARLVPWALGMWVLSVVWSCYIWLREREPTQWMEQGGAIANYVGIWVMLNQGWNIAISIITLLPLASIVIGTRFGRRAFYVGMLLSLVLLGTAAPPGYWSARPAFIPFALVLLIGLPLTVVRLLSALYAVSATALEARDAQGRIIAMISHELRTPLNTICNATHIIDTDGLASEDKLMMQTVANNANTLLYRVNQVLDVAAIDHGKLHLASEPFMVGSILQAMHDILGSRAIERGVEFDLRDRTGIERPLMGDAMRIEQVLTNLASNAIKCTPPGGQVIVTVETVGHSTNEVTLRFIVSDTGVGISDAEKKSIFQPFVQLSTGVGRQADGTGLGLYIVQGLTQALKATLTVQDREGGGTVFTWVVSLPKAAPGVRPAGNASVIEALEAHRTQGQALKLLVVDDHHANREVLHRLMQRAGHETVLVPDGPTALACLREASEPFDAVFLDLHMPGMSGQEVLAALRSAGITTPVIVLSADSDPDVVSSTLASGAIAYLVKPVAPHKVLEALEAVRGARPAAAAGASDGLAPALG